MVTVAQSVGVEIIGRDVAEGVDRDAGHAQPIPVGPQGRHVAVGVGVSCGGCGEQGRRRRAAGGAAVGPALFLVRR